MEPRDPASESAAVPASGRFEVIHHSLEYSAIGQNPDDDANTMQVTTDSGEKLAIEVPKDTDPVPYINEAMRLADSGEERGILDLSQGEQNG
jgi:hypothetical protein